MIMKSIIGIFISFHCIKHLQNFESSSKLCSQVEIGFQSNKIIYNGIAVITSELVACPTSLSSHSSSVHMLLP